MYINSCKIKVRYVETDKMGIVHHSNYYIWFEVGRTEFINATGISYSQIEMENLMLPVVESSCKYIEGAKYEDELTIETYISELTPARIVFSYNVIRNQDKKILAKGSTTHAFISNDFKVLNLKKKKPDLWEKFLSLYSG
ncbi:putative esterase [Clostridium homopropionicum DSM 5847]|uniref:Putative esterase n=1 Tax=Clostridium homopropionicum DSM 5847 TaxID=1121318 RepID=A0A0L6Z5N4_9CLOT|nr:thioesterase family protein [Clostridium homopropionicum]KOA18133.1 putative esterase [Clostridium homopropionicum DSM 5847]SFG96484.1 acyl-CoA thioester hydrolase [Clostridium homopropionicum]